MTTKTLLHSAMAGAYIFLTFLITHYLHSELAVASLGASAFIVFHTPHAPSATPRALVGGYIAGALCGLACAGFTFLFKNTLPIPSYIPFSALTVFAVTFLLITFHIEHPPAVAMAVTITVSSAPWLMALTGLGGAILLCLIGKVLKIAVMKTWH